MYWLTDYIVLAYYSNILEVLWVTRYNKVIMKRKISKVRIQEDVWWLVNKGFFINWHERNNACLKWNFWHPFVAMMHKSSQKIVPREYGNIIYILKLLNDDYTIVQVHFRSLVLLIHTWNFIYPCYSTMPPITQKNLTRFKLDDVP